ncbi:MAG: hypothetical protein G01um101431_998 [Parcubacteria group bacterium Gr01-1014_31]|nr:MAG: hypothetical protein G01um101431_998 [Parcubacteria group bacterium Gr01-1014_31]
MSLSGQNSERTLTVLEEIYRQSGNGRAGSRPKANRRERFRFANVVAPLTIGFGVLTLVVGVVQLRASLRFPVARISQLAPPSLSDFTALNPASLALGEAPDTDGDGLTDLEEQALGTSAYLEDTDSDGQPDRAEVTAGTDPTCPEGQTCVTAVAPEIAPTPAAIPSVGAPGFDPVAVRDQLRRAGLSDELLAGFSDQQLEEVYREVVQEQASSGVAASGTAPSAPDGQPPTGDGLRQLLLQQGLPKETLDRLSDEQLQQMMLEALRGGTESP